MGVRGGSDYLSGLKAHPKDVWISGREDLPDVTTNPAFRRPVAWMAGLYDAQIDKSTRAKMIFGADGEEAGLSFIVPRSVDDLVRRREAMRVAGRRQLRLDGAFAGLPEHASCRLCRRAGVFLRGRRRIFRPRATVLSLLPQPRSLSDACHRQSLGRPQQIKLRAGRPICLSRCRGGNARRPDRLSGAKMLATHGPTADELLVYPLPFSLRPGEEKYALAFGIPTDAPGLRFICREPFDQGASSPPGTTHWGRAFRGAGRHGHFRQCADPVGDEILYGNVAAGQHAFRAKPAAVPNRASDRRSAVSSNANS